MALPAVGALPVESPLPQNDAGSGRDAPDAFSAAFWIDPGVVYEGSLVGALVDSADDYAFHVQAGDVVNVHQARAEGCTYVFDAAGTQIGYDCVVGVRQLVEWSFVAPSTGTLFFEVLGYEPETYWIGFNLNRDAPLILVGQNDAGSGRDAGPGVDAVPILPGVTYQGSFVTVAVDSVDAYAFQGQAGQVFEISSWGAGDNCWYLHAPSGRSTLVSCSVLTIQLTLDETGTYTVETLGIDAVTYSFMFSLRGAAYISSPLPSNDAGSGADAPSELPEALPIPTGVALRGDIDGGMFDYRDVYGFQAAQGQAINAEARGLVGCLQILSPELVVVGETCPAGESVGTLSVTATSTGTWRVVYQVAGGGVLRVPQPYAFGVGLDAAAPDLGPVTGSA